MGRLFTDEQVSDILARIDPNELYKTRCFRMNEDVLLFFFTGNAGFEVVCCQWGPNEYGEDDWIEASRVTVWYTGDAEDDILFGVALALQRAENQLEQV